MSKSNNVAKFDQSDDLKKFLTSTKRKKINPHKKNKKKEEDKELRELMVDELFEIQKLKCPMNVINDRKRLEHLLFDICKTVNALTKCAAQQTRLTATELRARPTYVEEMNNIRDNIHKAVMPKEFAAGLSPDNIRNQSPASPNDEHEEDEEQ